MKLNAEARHIIFKILYFNSKENKKIQSLNKDLVTETNYLP